VFPVRYELGSYIPEDGILHSHRRENIKSVTGWRCSGPANETRLSSELTTQARGCACIDRLIRPQFLTTDPVFPGSIPGATRFSEK
jgi:hypothetical protein